MIKTQNYIKYLPNVISVSRIVFSIILIFFIEEKSFFVPLYLICGLTDVLDGFIARKLNLQTEIGARLDSLGDFFLFLLISIVMIKQTDFIWIVLLAIVFAVRIIAFVISKIKYEKFLSIHTIGNKISGFLVFLLPLFVTYQLKLLMALVFAISFLSAIEEIVIHIKSKKPNLNRKSLFTNEK